MKYLSYQSILLSIIIPYLSIDLILLYVENNEVLIPGTTYIVSNLTLGKHLDAGDTHDYHVSTSNRHDVYCQWMFIASNNSSLEGYYEIRNPFTGMNLDINQLEGVNHICKRSPNNCDSQLWTPVVGNTRIYFRLANKYLISTNSRNIFLDFDVVTDMITLMYHSSNMNDDDHHTAAAWWCLKTIGDSSDIEGQAPTLNEVTWPKSYESPVKLLSNGKFWNYLYIHLHQCIMHIY